MIDCSLSSSRIASSPLTWRTHRRLRQLREELHDVLRTEIGVDGFKRVLPDAFALRGGMPGTTSALNRWCAALAKCITKREISPHLVALTLQFLEVPAAPALASSSSQQKGYPAKAAESPQG